MIKIQDYNKENRKLELVTDMSSSLANAIRRSLLEIPVMAIDEVEIFKNDSALYDEIVAHRMGLIPIKTEKTSKAIKFKLKEKGPKSVYSDELSPSIDTGFKLPITILDKGQEIEIVAEAKLGKGIEHIKYSPGFMIFKHNVDEELLDYLFIDEEGKVNYNEEEMNTHNLSEERKKEIMKVKDVKELIIEMESWGQLEVKDIFTKAIEALSDNLKELNKAVK